MKKIISYISICLTCSYILAPFHMIENVYAVTDSYDFDDNTTYSISDTDTAYIHGGSAKLKGSLGHRGHIENGPTAMDWGTNNIYDNGYVYVTGYGSHAVTSIDVSDPGNMSQAGYLGANGTRRLYGAYDLKKAGNFVYVASYSADSLEVIDATDPNNLQHEGRLTNITSVKLNGARGIDVVGNYAYIASYIDDALQIIDISNPAVPVGKGYLQDNTRLNGAMGVEVVGNYAYVTAYGNDSLEIIDISDPDDPKFVGQLIDNTTTELNGAWGIEVVGNYAYIAAHIDDGLEIIDISDPTNPTHVGEIENSDPGVRLNGARELKIQGNYVYITASSDDNLEIIDISDPTTPKYIGNLDTDSYGELDGVYGISISNNTVFVNTYNNADMYSIDVTDPTAPNFIGKIYSGPTRLGNPVGLMVDDNYVYVASYGSNSLEIIDISDSANPSHAGAISDHTVNNELWGAWDVSKKGDYVYVSGYGDRGLETIDVSDPTNPISTSTIVDSNTVELQNPRGSFIEGNFLYVVSYYGDSLQIFDISNPSNPIPTGFYKDSGVLSTPNDVAVKGNYAFISDYIGDQIVVIDVSDPSNPVYETEISDGGVFELNGAWDLRVDENFLYVVSYIDNAVVVIDISDPTNPVYRGDLDDDNTMRLSRPRGIVYDEGYAYLSAWSNDSVVTFDVSDPDEPIFIDEIYNNDLYDTPTAIDKQENDIFFTQYYGSSLSVVRESYPSDSPYIIPDNAIDSSFMNSISLTYGTYNEGNVSFQLSKDNGTTWYYFDGTSWIATTAGVTNSNNIPTINSNIGGFNTLSGTGEIKWKAFLNSNGEEKVEIDQIEIDYFDEAPPIIEDTFPKENNLIPKHDFDLTFEYFDVDGAYGSGSVTENNGGAGINTTDGSTDFTNNIAPNASITASTATIWGVPPHPNSIVNGVKRIDGAYDYEYHSDTPNGFIEFNWDVPQKIGNMKIFNRVGCCSERLSNATIKLYNSHGDLIYTHTLGNTSGGDIIDIDFELLGEVHEVSTLRLDSVGANSYINIREIEIFPIEENLELYKWDGTVWGDNIAHQYIDFGNKTFGTGSATYPTLDIPFGKYKMDFEVSDLNGNNTSTGVVFYVDEPEFTVSTPEIDMGILDNSGNNFSPPVIVTVKTVGAAFNVTMNATDSLLYNSEEIQEYDGFLGYGYEQGPAYTSSIFKILDNQLIGSEVPNININGDKNTYTYELQLGGIVDPLQAGGDYLGDMDFDIDLQY